MPGKILAITLLLISSLFIGTHPALGDELDDINKQIAELNNALSQSKAATAPLKQQAQSIKTRVNGIEYELGIKKANIETGYSNLEKETDELNKAIRDYYINGYYFSPLLTFISAPSATDIPRLLAYQKAATEKDKQKIMNIALSLQELERKSEELKDEQKKLAGINANLAKIIGDAEKYQTELTGKISELSAKQTEIINSRSGGFTATIGDSDLADDYYASIKGFREAAPSGYFAVFSFGAHTHRKGMSQYGARGRAQSGQTVNQILSAYYGKEPVGKDTGGDVQVQGFGSMNFEDRYLMGIAEMPSSWHPEALKAQAIAARTYAYRYKVQGTAICTTEACQVYNDSKASNPPEAWRAAVQATRGQIIEDVVTYYASTHGGYTTTRGWDTTDGGGGGNFIEKAWEKTGGSPWLYKAWYTQGYSTSSDKCGRANPWLNPEEMADIVNAAIALRSGGIDTSRITPVSSCWGGSPYSMSELRDITPGGISSATSLSVSQGDGNTGNVTINGINISGEDFKRAFNLRAPGRLSIPQSGFAFFNVEKK